MRIIIQQEESEHEFITKTLMPVIVEALADKPDARQDFLSKMAHKARKVFGSMLMKLPPKNKNDFIVSAVNRYSESVMEKCNQFISGKTIPVTITDLKAEYCTHIVLTFNISYERGFNHD